jgi:hypothetical protein
MRYKKISVEVIVVADEDEAVVAELNAALDLARIEMTAGIL